MIKEVVDINCRYHVGWTPLHFAISCNAMEIASDFVDSGEMDESSHLHVSLLSSSVDHCTYADILILTTILF